MDTEDPTERERLAKERFAQLVTAASALAVARRWEAAGRAWIDAARFAVDSGAHPSARAALDAAGEAFRRDDRLDDAKRAIDSVMQLHPTEEEAALSTIRLAGMSGERCRPEEGLVLCRSIGAGPPALRAMALDTEIALLWQLGRLTEVRERVTDLVEVASGHPALLLAVRFRHAQLHRIDGAFADAERLLLGLIEGMRGQDGSDAGIAAIRGEIAENDLLRGETAAAIDGYCRARELHETSGRRGLAFGAEGGRVRAALQSGLHILDQGLDEGLAYANKRGLHALELELRLVLGTLLASRGSGEGSSVLKAVIHTAHSVGMRITAGRARVELATRTTLPVERRREELELSITELDGHIPLQQRAIAERSRW